MASHCCLLDTAPEDILQLTAAIGAAAVSIEITIALFDLVMLHALGPKMILIDVDLMKIEPLEAVRQLRFVLPNVILVVYAKTLHESHLRGFHNAGANAIISKSSSESEIAAGLRRTMASGCFTDPRFEAAYHVGLDLE